MTLGKQFEIEPLDSSPSGNQEAGPGVAVGGAGVDGGREGAGEANSVPSYLVRRVRAGRAPREKLARGNECLSARGSYNLFCNYEHGSPASHPRQKQRTPA